MSSHDPSGPVAHEDAPPLAAALGDLYKALRTVSFYPGGHPVLQETVQRVRTNLATLLAAGPLALTVSRSGLQPAGQPALAATPLTTALAKELFIRRVQALTILPDLTAADLQEFLAVVSLDPRRILEQGGIEQFMGQRQITTIWLNELDMAAILAKRQTLEEQLAAPEPPPPPPPEAEEDLASGAAQAAAPPEETSFLQVLHALDQEREDDRYRQLVELLRRRALPLLERRQVEPLFTALLKLQQHRRDQGRSASQRQLAEATLRDLAREPVLTLLIHHLEDRDCHNRDELHAILVLAGTPAVPLLLDRLARAEHLIARKALAVALVQFGATALPHLIAALKDERWYVVRNVVAILGVLGVPEAVRHLKGSAYHSDERVRKETLRSLAKIGGAEAEAILIGLLATGEREIRLQATLSLGTMKSQLAVQPLLDLVMTRDFFMDLLPLKREALVALGRIGDRRAAPRLLALACKRRLLALRGYDELRSGAIQALGHLGDESAIEPLRELAQRERHLASACREALELLERITS